MAPAVAIYEPRDPSHTVLYKVIAEHLGGCPRINVYSLLIAS